MPNTISRTGEQLKKCWNNLKHRSRQEQCLHSRYIRGTGGGGPICPPDPLLEKVNNVIPHCNFRVECLRDSDKLVSTCTVNS
ncbi:hypothetical protein L9F63_023747, partial [Diploptera punctata]